MKRLLVILIAGLFLLSACTTSVPTQNTTPTPPALNPTTTPNPESGLSTGSTSSDIQEQLNELQQQVQRLNQRVDALDKEFEQEIGALTQRVDELEERISSLERELETLPATTDSDFEARTEQQITQLVERLAGLEEQLDELSSEVVTIKQQQAVKIIPSSIHQTDSIFSGRGNSVTAPFTATHSPFCVEWQATSTANNVSVLKIGIWRVGEYKVSYLVFAIVAGSQDGYGYVYMPEGQYYLEVEASAYVYWDIWIK